MIIDPINQDGIETMAEVCRNEMLISEVQKRIPLWNHTVPTPERARNHVQKLWEEIASAMNGMLINKRKVHFQIFKMFPKHRIFLEYYRN